MEEKERITIVIPIYNDWQSLSLLLNKISDQLSSSFREIKVIVVNDASTENPYFPVALKNIRLEILHLRSNLGHQKAIAIGVAYLAEHGEQNVVVIMDGDGEDDPSDISLLVNEHEKNSLCIVFAKRNKRKDGVLFSLFYVIYKIIFKIFTGKSINFGNFCLIPSNRISAIAHITEIWNHFSGGIIKSNFPYKTVSLNRKKRLAGKSKMNLVSLVIHGISSISIYIDVVSVRLLIFFGGLILASFSGIISVVILKIYTDLAIP
jgi:glycosyltransferase involved in cell wall biosynthesis